MCICYVINSLFNFCQDYVFVIFMGYMDFFVGVEVKEDLYFNFYFFGQLIVMVLVLYNEIIEYEDGKMILFIVWLKKW